MTTSYSWIKLWHEILDDPKMGKLSDHLWRRSIEIFLIAGRNGQTGELPPESDMCWTLRVDAAQLRTDLEQLQAARIVHWDGAQWWVTNFAKRQAATPGAQRVSDFRKRQKTNSSQIEAQEDNADVTERYNCNVQNVTSPVRESYSYSSSLSYIYTLYESEIGTLTKSISEALDAAAADYPEEWVRRAFQESAIQNKRSWSYVNAILKRWKAQGFDTKKTVGGNGSQPSIPAVPRYETVEELIAHGYISPD